MKTILKKAFILLPSVLSVILVDGLSSPAHSSQSSGLINFLDSNPSTVLCAGGATCGSNDFQFSNFSTTDTNVTWLGSLATATPNGLNIEIDQGLETGTYFLTFQVTAPSGTVFSLLSLSGFVEGSPGTGAYTYTTSYNDGGSNLTTTNAGSVSRSPNNASLSTLNATTTITIGDVMGKEGGTFTNSYQAVPWETDALPLVGATALFAGGVWWKRRRGAEALDLSEATPDPEQSR